MDARTLYVDTLRELAAPRRAVPIAILSAALLGAQLWFSRGLAPLVGGVGALASFLFASPFLWRLWRPATQDRDGVPLAGVPLLVLTLLPIALVMIGPALGRGDAFLSAGLNGVVVGALFFVGGWGLARDIDLEAGLSRQRERAEALARHAEQAQLLALKAHLDPHFLFNTLNAIAAWCAEDPAVAETALLRLASVLREAMEGVKAETWPLSRELALARDVAGLYAVRDPGRFALDWQVGDVPDVPTPPMVLLPAVENAFTHGPGAGHGGGVVVRVEVGEREVRVVVRNGGAFRGRRPGGQGIGLVERRAALAGGRFEVRGDGHATEAVLVLPR